MQSGLIADDLTGALDGGLQLFRMGHAVTVYFPWADLSKSADSPGFIVLDTESRNVDPDEARKRTRRALSLLADLELPLVYKKIDSTLRGNTGIEISTILDGTSFDAVLVTPALPKLGRTVKEGMLLLDGVPLAETEFSSDPLAPVKSSAIAEIISQDGGFDCVLVDGQTVASAAANPEAFLESLLAERESAISGPTVLIPDSESDEELKKISKFAAGCGSRLLPCGSAGLLEYIAGEIDISPAAAVNKTVAKGKASAPVLIITASMSAVTRRQIDYVVESGTAAHIKPEKLALTSDAGEAAAYGRQILGLLRKRQHVVLDVGGRREELPADQNEAAKRSDRLLKSLSTIVATVFDESAEEDIGGLVLGGGETAITVCRALKATGIKITGESEPFVPSGNVIGGSAAGLGVITKAGGFGSDTVFADACTYLSNQS